MRQPLTMRIVQELQAIRLVQGERRDPVRSALIRQVREAMSLPLLPTRSRVKGSVWAISLVKNEADIVGRVIEHLFRQGVDGILVADNGSSDDTPVILARLADTHPLYVARDREPAHFQGRKMDVLSDAVRRAGADWVIPFDADEFWFAPGMTVAGFLRSQKSDKVSASIHNLYPVSGIAFGEGPWNLQEAPQAQSKCAFRSHRYSRLYEGNHWVKRPGQATDGLRLLHVPWRSYEQFRRKSVQGLNALSHALISSDVGRHWRHLGELPDAAAREAWNEILRGHEVEGISSSPHGSSQQVDPTDWPTWDPDRLLPQ